MQKKSKNRQIQRTITTTNKNGGNKNNEKRELGDRSEGEDE